MEKIEKLNDCKIENLNDIYGGERTPTTNATGTTTDVRVWSEGYADYTIIDNLGFWNWLSGDRTVTTYYVINGGTPDQTYAQD